jgi:hypothetical protein
LYVILPNTRISILPSKEEDGSTKREQDTSRPEPGNDSGVSSMILRTVRCLRGARKAPVARFFLLSGPPGVGQWKRTCFAVSAIELGTSHGMIVGMAVSRQDFRCQTCL